MSAFRIAGISLYANWRLWAIVSRLLLRVRSKNKKVRTTNLTNLHESEIFWPERRSVAEAASVGHGATLCFRISETHHLGWPFQDSWGFVRFVVKIC